MVQPGETKVEMAQRHVRESEVHVAQQLERIAELRRDGHPTAEAEVLLLTFQDTLRTHQEGLEALRADQAAERRWGRETY